MSPAVPSPGPQTAPAPSAAAQSSFKEESFTLTLEAPDEVTAGSEAEFKVTLLAQGGYKINEEYPIKFQFEGVKGYLPKQAIVKKADGQVDKTTAVLPLVLTVEKAGKVDVGGKLSFSVCTDERCLIEKRDLTLSVDAS